MGFNFKGAETMDLQGFDQQITRRGLLRYAEHYGVKPYLLESRRSLRRRLCARIMPGPWGTIEGTRNRVLSMCFGLRGVVVDPKGAGVVEIRLWHRWRALPWRRSNLRKVRAALPDLAPVGADFRVR